MCQWRMLSGWVSMDSVLLDKELTATPRQLSQSCHSQAQTGSVEVPCADQTRQTRHVRVSSVWIRSDHGQRLSTCSQRKLTPPSHLHDAHVTKKCTRSLSIYVFRAHVCNVPFAIDFIRQQLLDFCHLPVIYRSVMTRDIRNHNASNGSVAANTDATSCGPSWTTSRLRSSCQDSSPLFTSTLSTKIGNHLPHMFF